MLFLHSWLIPMFMRTGISGSGVLVKEKEIFFPVYKVIYFDPDAIAEPSSFIISWHCDTKHAFRGRLSFVPCLCQTPTGGLFPLIKLRWMAIARRCICYTTILPTNLHAQWTIWCLIFTPGVFFLTIGKLSKEYVIISSLTTWISSFIFLLHLK